MIPTFRETIFQIENKITDPVELVTSPLHQLKCMFTALAESEKQYFNPKLFCNSMKDWDGNPLNVFTQ